MGLFGTDKKDLDKKKPKNVKVIAPSCSQNRIFLTVIDLDNNEVVILCYLVWDENAEFINVIRSGLFVNPDEQPSISEKDAPV